MRDIAALAERVLSPRTGLIKSLLFLPGQARSAGFFNCINMTPDYGRLPHGHNIQTAGALGLTERDAIVKSIFEGLERYSGAHIDHERLVWSKPTSAQFLHSERFPIFAPWQHAQPGFPFAPLDDGSEVFWLGGTSLFDLERRFVPAAMVYVPYRPASRADNLGLSTSTGMAAGWTRDEALLSGLLETVERDAFMIMWLNRLSMPQLRLPAGSVASALIAERLDRSGATCALVDLTMDHGIPTVMAVMHQRIYGQACTTLGLSAKPDHATAALKAFHEASSSAERIRYHLDQNSRAVWQPKEGHGDFTSLEQRDLAYTSPALRPHLHFLDSSAQAAVRATGDGLDGADAGAQLLDALRRLRAVAGEAVAVDLAPGDVASLGVKVVKVLVPELVPLTADHRYPSLGHRRIFEVPVRLGYRSTPHRLADLNPHPHPFA